jgi:catechol 2,3-dioxygenase-like lactoylglutathione lyase family enzyme
MTRTIVLACAFLVYAATSSGQIASKKPANTTAADSVFRPYWIGIVVANAEKAANWYKEKLGFAIIRQMSFPDYDSMKIVHLELGKAVIELVQRKTSFSIKKYVPDYDGFGKSPMQGLVKVAFYVADATALASKLRAANVKFRVDIFDSKEFGVRSFIIEDLDGNFLQFNQRL